jgi:hypothetical protein
VVEEGEDLCGVGLLRSASQAIVMPLNSADTRAAKVSCPWETVILGREPLCTAGLRDFAVLAVWRRRAMAVSSVERH